MSAREDWQRRLGPLYGGAVALVASTPWRWPDAVVDEPRGPAWMVVLGLPIGAVAWLVAALAHGAGLPAAVAAVLGLAALCGASAGLVERGLADRFERGSPTSTLVLAFTVVVRAAAIVTLPPDRWLGVLIATAVVGRWAAVFLQSLGEPIRGERDARTLVTTVAPAWLTAVLSLVAAVILVVTLGKGGLLVLALATGATFGLGLDAQRRDGSLSAPVLALAAAVGELLVLLVACAA